MFSYYKSFFLQAVNYYKTSFDPPKKEQREKKLSLNIQKFLARQEEEKRHKLEEDERKKQVNPYLRIDRNLPTEISFW